MKTPRLRLVGGIYKGSPDETIPFLIQTFGRLSEVKHAHNVARQVQYASGTSDRDYIHFLGVEVDRIECIPAGFMAWEIDGDLWSILEPRNGKDEVIWQEKLTWQWLDQSVHEKPCGEFTARCPDEWNNDAPALREFRIVSNGYIGAPLDDAIDIVDYNPSWPQMYIEMQERIKNLLGSDIALRIEHYGSTSIPGMPAKPVIDILVEIPSCEEARKRAVPAFNSPENEYWYYKDHMCFILRDRVTGIRTHHIHMAPAGHRLWEGLAFRDYLRTHPADAARYVDLKRDLARRCQGDREGYTDAKESFVREITDKALRGQG
ncbi:MAG: GrpB family protein [Armatimonadota bacterium]